MIEAISIFGNIIKVPKEKFTLRVSAYGVCMHENKILLVKVRSSGKWFFPGGGVEIGEKLEEAVIRECKEETNIDVKVNKYIDVLETYFYYDPSDKAWQSYSFFYEVTPLNFEVNYDNQREFDETAEPQWIEISTLKKEDFQVPAQDIFKYIKQ